MRVRGANAVFVIAATTTAEESENVKARVQVLVIDPELAAERGRLLRQLRRSAGATLGDVSQRSTISKRRLALAEAGTKPLTPAEWRLVAKSLRTMIRNRVGEGMRSLQLLSA